MSKLDMLKRGGVLLVPGEHVERIIDHPDRVPVESIPRVPQNLMVAKETSYTIRFRTDQDGILIFESMKHLMQDYVLYFAPEMVLETIRRSSATLTEMGDQKLLLTGLKKVVEEIEAKILRES